MKIWVIGRGYPTPDNRMWGSFELEQAKLLARHGNEVSYIALTLSFFSRKDPRGYRQLEEDGVKIYTSSHLYFPGKSGIYLQHFEDGCWRKLLNKVAKQEGLPDLIHIHYPSMIGSPGVMEEYRKKGVKIFATEHWTRVQSNKLKGFEKRRLGYYTDKANCLITVGNALERAIRDSQVVNVDMKTIPNMVSPVFQYIPSKEPAPFTFAVSGRMVPHKRFDIIIRQFLRVFAGNSNVRLKLIGNGEEREKLEKIAGGSQQIVFTGTIPSKNVAEELQKSSALICYSALETFAVPVIEAWASGLPVIVLDSIPVSAYCDPTRGLVISDANQDDLGDAMQTLFTNIEQYDGQTISDYAMKTFGDKAIYEQLYKTYQEY